MLRIDYIYSEEEAVRANREVTNSASKLFVLLPWFGTFLILGSILLIYAKMMKPVDSIFSFALGGVFALMPIWQLQLVRRQFRNNPQRDTSIVWEFDDTEIRNKGEGVSGTYRWEKLFEIKEKPMGILIYPQEKLAHWIPKSAFKGDSDLESLRKLIAAKNVRLSS